MKIIIEFAVWVNKFAFGEINTVNWKIGLKIVCYFWKGLYYFSYISKNQEQLIMRLLQGSKKYVWNMVL